MAWLELPRSGVYQLVYRYANRKWKRSLKTKDLRRAEAARARLEENLRLAEQGILEVPDEVDASTFFLSDGKRAKKPKPEPSLTLGQLFAEYQHNLPPDSLEVETLRVARIHMGHLKRIIGANTAVRQVSQKHLQHYVLERSKASGKHGKRLSSVTIKKELGTFSAVWSFARVHGYITSQFPSKGLKFPKTSDKPPFQTREQIERQIATGGLSDLEQAELWNSLFLTLSQIDDLLQTVKERAQYEFLYPMLLMAAHTGARRSELCRSRVADFQFDAGIVVIRERKRVQGHRSTRQVAMSPSLTTTIRDWFTTKRSSVFAFPREFKVDRNRKLRENEDAVSVDEASHHLALTLAGSDWHLVRGWHVLRHSFCSNCAAAGIDQRLINAWVGHQTDAMVRRYRHLIPDQQQSEIQKVFGR